MKFNRLQFGLLAASSAAFHALPVFAGTDIGAYPANFHDVHNRLITIDGAVPLLAGTLNPDDFERWI